MNPLDASIQHARTLLREHAERYLSEIVVEPTAWRRRYDELRQDLEWLEFVKKFLLQPTPACAAVPALASK